MPNVTYFLVTNQLAETAAGCVRVGSEHTGGDSVMMAEGVEHIDFVGMIRETDQ